MWGIGIRYIEKYIEINGIRIKNIVSLKGLGWVKVMMMRILMIRW